MPQFTPLTHEDFRRRGGGKVKKLDLSPYSEFLSSLATGEGGPIELEEEDAQRTIKRRLTIVAHSLGHKVKWRSAPDRKLRFQLVEPKPQAAPVPEPAPAPVKRGRKAVTATA